MAPKPSTASINRPRVGYLWFITLLIGIVALLIGFDDDVSRPLAPVFRTLRTYGLDGKGFCAYLFVGCILYSIFGYVRRRRPVDWASLGASRVGIIAALVVALFFVISGSKMIPAVLQTMGVAPWLASGLVVVTLLCALAFGTVPLLIERRSIKGDSGAVAPAARRSWRTWLPWMVAVCVGAITMSASVMARIELRQQGWKMTIVEGEGVGGIWDFDRGYDDRVLRISRDGPIPPESVPVIGALSPPFWLEVHGLHSDPSLLSKLRNLTHLTLGLDETVSLSALGTLDNLRSLDLYVDKPVNLAVLREMKSLKTLQLVASGDATDSAPIGQLTHLEGLYLSLTDLRVLKDLATLRTLYLTVSPADISPLRMLKGLTRLDLALGSVEDISPLRDLSALQALDLSGTKVTDISPLSGLKALEALDLSHTKVTDVSPLAGLENLRHLDLRDTPAKDVSALRHLRNLSIASDQVLP